MAEQPQELHLGLTARLVKVFLLSKLPTIIILVSLLAGLMALLVHPPGRRPPDQGPHGGHPHPLSRGLAHEVENLVVINLEKKLWEMEGLEDLYSQARDGFAIVTAKFKVGENLETSLFKVYNKVFSNIDQVPQGVTGWVVKPMSINDVPIVTLTLYSNAADDYELRRVADELLHRLQSHSRHRPLLRGGGAQAPGAGGGRPGPPGGASAWTWRRWPRPSRSATSTCRRATFPARTGNTWWRPGHFSRSADEVANLLVGLNQGKPVYLKDVAEVIDGPEEPVELSTIAFGPADELPPGYVRGQFYPAVTMAVAKRTGTNAVTVAQGILDRVNELKAGGHPARHPGEGDPGLRRHRR